jgi:hypothetical protein
MVKAGRVEEFEASVERSVPLLQFWLEREHDQYDRREPESRARAHKTVGARLARVATDLARGEYARFVAQRLGVDLGAVGQAIGRRWARRSGGPPGRRPADRFTPRTRSEHELLRTVLADAGLVDRVDRDWLADPTVIEAFDLMVPASGEVEPGMAVPLPSTQSEASDLLTELAMSSVPPSPFDDVVTAVKRAVIEDRIRDIQFQLDDAEAGRGRELTEELQRLHRERRGLGSDPS